MASTSSSLFFLFLLSPASVLSLPFLIQPPLNPHLLQPTYAPGEPDCARLWNPYGYDIHLQLNERLEDLGLYNFVPVRIEVRERCALTIVDSSLKTDWILSSTEEYKCYPLIYAHCESCLGRVGREGNSCALLYDAPLCSTSAGVYGEVAAGEEVPQLHDFGRKISSLVVREGCSLEIFDEEEFGGRGAVVEGTVDLLDPSWDDRIASFKCNCGGSSMTTSMATSVATTESSTSADAAPSSTIEVSSTMTTTEGWSSTASTTIDATSTDWSTTEIPSTSASSSTEASSSSSSGTTDATLGTTIFIPGIIIN